MTTAGQRAPLGQVLLTKSDSFNYMMEGAEFAHRFKAGARTAEYTRDANRVWVRNDSDSNQPAFAVLGISDAAIKPSANLENFQNDPCLVGVKPKKPDHVRKFCILQEPAPSSSGVSEPILARGLVAGVTPCQVYMNNDSDRFADVKDGQAGYLDSGGSGAAEILWVAPGSNSQDNPRWAVVRLGNSSSAPDLYELTSGPTYDTELAEYSWTAKPVTSDDDSDYHVSDSATEETVWMPTQWRQSDPVTDPSEADAAAPPVPFAKGVRVYTVVRDKGRREIVSQPSQIWPIKLSYEAGSTKLEGTGSESTPAEIWFTDRGEGDVTFKVTLQNPFRLLAPELKSGDDKILGLAIYLDWFTSGGSGSTGALVLLKLDQPLCERLSGTVYDDTSSSPDGITTAFSLENLVSIDGGRLPGDDPLSCENPLQWQVLHGYKVKAEYNHTTKKYEAYQAQCFR
jgi:hypothetical protein